MTTTSAARLRTTLETLKCQVVIVEEAAEVLESHIIAAVTKHCEHLILIGDHQQLKPTTADYNIESKYKLGISLFERMVLNKIQCHTLNVQHRMRPEISALLTPTIYPNLENHKSVLNRSLIGGVEKPLFFISHNHPEEDIYDGSSKINQHEATFLIALARHLVLNGYNPVEITILAAYSAQMFEIRKEAQKVNILERLRIEILDNYQGEENDIILLSLVRNNDENNIGFLKIENRVCVALSRARNGMYIMGNMDQLCSASPLWCKIRKSLEDQQAIGSKLLLRCQIHPDHIIAAETASDFENVLQGGCNVKCNEQLNCGHRCTLLCHPLDREHENYCCNFTCNRLLCEDYENHLCKKMCYEECDPCDYKVLKKIPCGHEDSINCSVDVKDVNCTVMIQTTLLCGHQINRPCYRDPNSYPCPIPCEKKIEACTHTCERDCHVNDDPDHSEYKCPRPCQKFAQGCTLLEPEKHLCNKKCFEDCSRCNIIVPKKRTICPHTLHLPCHLNVDLQDCNELCEKKLECGHLCKKKCSQPCGNCETQIIKEHPICGHSIRTKCSEVPNRKNCDQKCPLLLSCGHPCTATCKMPCPTKCMVLIDCQIVAECEHDIRQIPCYIKQLGLVSGSNLVQYCTEPCKTKLKCGHLCTGNCNECLQGSIHKTCLEKCEVILICSHPCKRLCNEACKPCNLKCPYRCVHMECNRRCGEPCLPCTKPCPRKCQHQQCEANCSELCSIAPCKEPCPLILNCQHSCVGYCGEPCPPCHTCDASDDVFFETGEHDDARFVVLNDCGHVIENTTMEHWLTLNSETIGFKVCPKCKTHIKTTLRFNNYIKETYKNLVEFKQEMIGTKQENDKNTVLMLQRAVNCVSNASHTDIYSISTKLKAELSSSKKGKFIDKIELKSINVRLQILKEIIKLNNLNLKEIIHKKQLEKIKSILQRENNYLSNQEIYDIQQQLLRLRRLTSYFKIKATASLLTPSKDEFQALTTQLDKYLLKFTIYKTVDDEHVLEHLKKLRDLINPTKSTESKTSSNVMNAES